MTWLGVLRFVGWVLGVVGLGLIMNWAPRKRLSLWQGFGIVSGCFLLSLWLPHLFGPHAFLERPWITLGLAPALSVRVGAVCTGVILGLRRRMAAESPE